MPNLETNHNQHHLSHHLRRLKIILITFSILLFACGLLSPAQPQTATPAPIQTPTETPFSAMDTTVPPTEVPTQTLPPAVPTLSPDRVNQIPNPEDYTWQLVADGFNKPVYVANAGDGSGRLFVVEKPGRIWILQNGQRQSSPFLDIRDIVNSQKSERGLLSLAFHPDYAENGYFYVYYTNLNGDTVLARYQVSADPNTADPNSAQILLTISQPYANHNGGTLAFGPDGYLYLSTGDGGSGGDPQGNGQNLGVLLGKVLRLDVNGGLPYAIPPDNPFVGLASARGEIWLYGLRNPWRYSFDRATGDMLIGDVGQGTWEEIDWLPTGVAGLNLGWNLFEGNHLYAGSQDQRASVYFPILEYDHSGGNCSVTGGYVYRGAELPQLYGVYLYGDYCSGLVWGALPGPDGQWQAQQLYHLSVSLASFGEDEAGELYLVDLNGGIYRLVRN